MYALIVIFAMQTVLRVLEDLMKAMRRVGGTTCLATENAARL